MGKETNRWIFDLPFRFASSDRYSELSTAWFERLKTACDVFVEKDAILTFEDIKMASKQWDEMYPTNDLSGPGGICGPNKLDDDELLGYLWEFAQYGLIIFIQNRYELKRIYDEMASEGRCRI